MRKWKIIASNDRHIYKITMVSFLLICIAMVFSCFLYYNHLEKTIKAETGSYIQENAEQMGNNLSKTINNNFAVLGTIASSLDTFQVDSFEVMGNVVHEYEKYWQYQNIILIDESGVAYDDKGKDVSLNSDQYLQDAVIGRQQSMSPSQVIDGKECIVFAIPIDNVTIDGIKMVALAGSYSLKNFDTMLEMKAFGGKGYAHIIGKDGTVIIRSSSENALKTGYNVLNSLSTAEIQGSKNLELIKSEIANEKSGQTEFILGDAHEYMTYSPLDTAEWSLLTFVPVSSVNEKSIDLFNLTLLLCFLITIAFSLLFVVLLSITFRNKRKLERIAYVDSVTGGNTIERFYELTQNLVESADKSQYAMIYLNIEKFKLLNEQFSRKSCDEILCSIEYGISRNLDKDECVGRLFADNFCILVKYKNEDELIQRFAEWQNGSFKYMEGHGLSLMTMTIEFGVFVIDNNSIPLAYMVDRAKLSLTESLYELKGKMRYAIYNEQLRRTLLREKQLEDIMDESLLNREFEVYLQPKFNTQTERIEGAEALVRWISATEGMVYPDDFIPLFEKNGFVVQIDLFVFEEVCRTIERWIKEGKEVVKISVNCSRVHLKSANFLDSYIEIAKRYDLPKNAVEIELTENAVFEDVEYLSRVIREIHNAGFGCSMDDFGSGYSSLNLIQDIPVDTIKLDKVFFRTASRDIRRTESVVGCVISMAKALQMETVAEGVEEREQVDMLKGLNCDLIQGYYFAKPMPINEFEDLAFDD